MKLTKKQIYVLELPFDTFLKYYTGYKATFAVKKALLSAVMELKSCGEKEAREMKIKDLIKFSKLNWLSCKGIGGKTLDILCDALKLAGLSTNMNLDEPDDSEVDSLNSDLHSAFENLQQQLVETGTEKCELKMIRPDGYVWVISVECPDKSVTSNF